MEYLQEAKQFYKKNISRIQKPNGSSVEAIDNLETQIRFTLPEAYRQYLLWMGDDINGIFTGTNCFLRNAIQNTQWLPNLLAENQVSFDLPNNYLAFFSHQGYRMAWFELPKESENPQIYEWGEHRYSITPIIHFSINDFLLTEFQIYVQFSAQ